MDQRLEDIDPDARKKYDRDMKQQAKEVEANAAKEYENKSKAENAAERKQIADVTRAERAYRIENNIPMSPKTNPGYYHMEGGPKAGGGGGSGAGDLEMSGMNMRKPKPTLKAGGKVRSTSSKRADGIAQKGHTKGKYL